MDRYIFHPEITFEDTNLVGNVYYANFVRWQNECRDDWLKETVYETYADLFRGNRRMVVTELNLKFHDPTGAALGDSIEVDMTTEEKKQGLQRLTFEMRRIPRPGSSDSSAVLVTGHQCFTIVEREAQWTQSPVDCDPAEPSGPAYVMEFPIPLTACLRDGHLSSLDLVRWQGKCRERFLAEHAPELLKAVAAGHVALHTNQVGLSLVEDTPIAPSDRIRLKMRMTDLKSRLTVRFDYELANDTNVKQAARRIATGTQVLCCKRQNNEGHFAACVFPSEMLRALRHFATSDHLRSCIDDLFAHETGADLNLSSKLPCTGPMLPVSEAIRNNCNNR